jgi:hypothetical protein
LLLFFLKKIKTNMRRITQDFNTCGDTIISSSCVIYPNNDLTLQCPDLCFPSNLTEIIKCINDSINLTGLDLKCAAPNCVDCFEYTIKNVLQLLLDKVCVPFDCVAAKACVDCNYIRSCITIPTPEPRITCNEIKAPGCVDCAYIQSCVTPYTLSCLTVQGCVGVQYLETTLAQSFDFATYNTTTGVFDFNCATVKAPGCIDCEYIRSCIPAVTCDQVLPCISCAFLQSKIDQVGCLTFPPPDLSFSSPYIYFKTELGNDFEFDKTVPLINAFKAIEQSPNVCSGVTYTLKRLDVNITPITASTLSAIETYLTNTFLGSSTPATGIYHFQISSNCGSSVYIGNEIQFYVENYQQGELLQTIKSHETFNDSHANNVYDPADKYETVNNHYLGLIYSNGSILAGSNVQNFSTVGFRQTFNSTSLPIPTPILPALIAVNSTNPNKNPSVWIENFKIWLRSFYNYQKIIYTPASILKSEDALAANNSLSSYSNKFKVRIQDPIQKIEKLYGLTNHGGEINTAGTFTALNLTGPGTSSGHSYIFENIKLIKPI